MFTIFNPRRACAARVTGQSQSQNGLLPVLLTVNGLSPPRPRTRFARPRFALSRSDWAIHFPTQTLVGWFHARSLHVIRTIGSVVLCIWPAGLPEVVTRLVSLESGDSPFCDCDCP